MSPAVLERPKAASVATGIITRMPAAADEVKFLVLNAQGDVASESTHPAPDGSTVTLSFQPRLMDQAGSEVYFLLVEGYSKGKLAWEQSLGRYQFHASK